ncbi:hypothetical protein NDU88_001946 [Pleurodeles waltl]|uniref:Uncharacterized protein n=1 Tax=Pleurodeles waltl TaxID=8319 RepID=A0AAV7LAY4_PLEWA|nr:hypothetical protein NDU88_001946 [Pleurodeles waltl]
MATVKSGDKSSGKPARQLLFSEAFHQSRPPTSLRESQPVNSLIATENPEQGTTMDCILQEITEVGRRLEGMDFTISTLAAETKFICLDIAYFQSRVSDLEQCVIALEDHLNIVPEQDPELFFLRNKLIDLEDRSRRDNIRFFGFTEHIEGTDVQTFLIETLPNLTGISFDLPPLEFQRSHHQGLKRAEDSH